MFNHNPENPDSSSDITPASNMPEWLNELRPASASSLQASVFYQAGYEAARHELGNAVWRRASIIAIAASVFIASASGALLFQLGKQNGQSIAVFKQDQEYKQIDAPEINRESKLASASPKRLAPTESSPTLIPSWFQSQFSRMMSNAKPRVTLLGPGVELGPMGAKLDEIIVLNSAADLNSRNNESDEASEPTEPQSLRAIRDNRIRSLMESLL